MLMSFLCQCHPKAIASGGPWPVAAIGCCPLCRVAAVFWSFDCRRRPKFPSENHRQKYTDQGTHAYTHTPWYKHIVTRKLIHSTEHNLWYCSHSFFNFLLISFSPTWHKACLQPCFQVLIASQIYLTSICCSCLDLYKWQRTVERKWIKWTPYTSVLCGASLTFKLNGAYFLKSYFRTFNYKYKVHCLGILKVVNKPHTHTHTQTHTK